MKIYKRREKIRGESHLRGTARCARTSSLRTCGVEGVDSRPGWVEEREESILSRLALEDIEASLLLWFSVLLLGIKENEVPAAFLRRLQLLGPLSACSRTLKVRSFGALQAIVFVWNSF